MRKPSHNDEVAFEESLGEEWERDVEVVEVPLGNRPLFFIGLFAFLLAAVVGGRIIFLGVVKGASYRDRAVLNLEHVEKSPAPRGLITDRYGVVLADNQPESFVFLNMKEFVQHKELQEQTLETLSRVLNVSADEIWGAINNADPDRLGEAIPIAASVNQNQLVSLKSLDLPTITVEDGFRRYYKDGPMFAQILGYVGFPSADDLRSHPEVGSGDMIGKDGVEAYYDKKLRGAPGTRISLRDATGNVLDAQEKNSPLIGETLRLTIDSEFQLYFYNRLSEQLKTLGRQVGAGAAVDPRTGEVLALVQVPTFDNNILGGPGKNDDKKAILISPLKPLFNRIIAGLYSPGSTIKPLVGIAALKEGIINPQKEIFSPGYIDIPNPYNPDKPTRYRDWQYQGYVNLTAAIAQSSDVYFYEVGGGTAEMKGLGISRLRAWWEKFNLGNQTGIDLPGEAKGFLPSIEWKGERQHKPWLLGDTYNVSIGQGDLLLTPIELLTYFSGIAMNGILNAPVVAEEAPHPRVLADLSYLATEIGEVQKGMRAAITSPKGTIRPLADLPFAVAAKTGSVQVYNNTKLNAFFVGYAPAENPRIAILVLVENAKEGGMNAIPIAKDVLNWYWEHRINSAGTAANQ